MKFKNIRFITLISLMLMFLAASCRDDTFSDYWDDANSDTFTVTLNVGLEGSGGTRTEGDWEEAIGNGSKIDMLVYAVYYDRNKNPDNPDWVAATEYVKEENPVKAIQDVFDDYEDIKVTLGHGQTVLNVENKLTNNKKHPITLTLKKGQEYKVVFWAQNHLTEAFVIDDLKRVQMKYKLLDEKTEENGEHTDEIHSVNNDEARDAFCRSVSLSGDQSKQNITIYLRRPLAQINVGTRGFDFESITRNAAKDEKYLYSKIRINRAARYLNVVTDEIYTTTTESDDTANSTEAFYTIDYEYSRIPAYWRWEEESVPDYPSYTKYDLENNSGAYETFLELHPEKFEKLPGVEDKAKEMQNRFKELYGKEEFLKVHLYDETKTAGLTKDEDGYVTYTSMGNSLDKEDTHDYSEVFKYLSMCYVLTNSSDEYQDVLTNVKVWVSPNKDGDGEVEIANLLQVPVQRNHRTNIVGSLLTAKAEMQIVVDEDFAGRKIKGDIESGEIVEGFYYDREKDEFQISSVNGLLFFQQLVNGDLTVRQLTSTDNGVRLGGPYPYTNTDDRRGTVRWLKYKSWSYEDVESLGEGKAELLIKALKLDKYVKGSVNSAGNTIYTWSPDDESYTVEVIMEDKNEGDGNSPSKRWPKFNNFSFFGATVKLMADINLYGIEWIPIGFDCVNWDISIGYPSDKAYSLDQNNQINATNYRTLVKLSDNKPRAYFDHRRVFAGTFDGNGHTIYNLRTKEFGSEIFAYSQQNEFSGSSNAGPYDNIQWFGRGFFGLCGPNVVLKDIRLKDVNITGNNGVAGLVAIVSSAGFKATIDNCIIDGGSITAVPLYRYEIPSRKTANYYFRTHARGVYVSGIVGQFCALGDDAGVTNCEVRNVTISGFRRVGGIIGSVADQSDYSMGNASIQLDVKVKDNSVSNSLILCNQIFPFNYFWNEEKDNKWKNGFGWGNGGSTTPMSGIIVGGRYENEFDTSDPTKNSATDAFGLTYTVGTNAQSVSEYFDNYIPGNNTISNVNYSVLASQPNTSVSKLTGKGVALVRESDIENISLENIPMLSSLMMDEVNLTDNYYGKAQLHTKIDFKDDIELWKGDDGSGNSFIFPINFPNDLEINYDENSPLTGMYVETVYISGENAPGASGSTRRSVITPTGIEGEGSSVIYVTARDRKQFEKNLKGSGTSNKTLDKTTTIKNVVLRGSPYAWSGILMAPNENMDTLNLVNVTIYDVYKTLALQEVWTSDPNAQTLQNYTYWDKYSSENCSINKLTGEDAGKANVELNATDCNFRGYTVPGAGWSKINYKKTTFEQGSETKYSYDTMESEKSNEYKTCKVEAPTTFKDCFFKAPFYIDIAEAVENNMKVTFTGCNASSAYDNVGIDSNKDIKKISDYASSLKSSQYLDKETGEELEPKLYYIQIEKSIPRGETDVTYHIGVKLKTGEDSYIYKVIKSVFIDGSDIKDISERKD